MIKLAVIMNILYSEALIMVLNQYQIYRYMNQILIPEINREEQEKPICSATAEKIASVLLDRSYFFCSDFNLIAGLHLYKICLSIA